MKRYPLAALVAIALCLAAFADLPIMPPVKEGLWKIHNVDTYSDQPTQDNTYFLCRSHAYDDSVREKMKAMQSKCVTSSDASVGNKRSFTTTCDVAGYHTVTKANITIGDNSFHSETESTMTAGGHTSTNRTVQDQTYVGACPAGMAPGDRKLADGTIQKHR
jgi:hypothetical protein